MGYALALVDWVKRHALWLLLMAVGSWTGAVLIRRRSNAVSTIDSALSVERAKARIAALRVESAGIAAVDQKKANELLRIHSDIEHHKKEIVEIYAGRPWASMTDAEVQEALRAAGV